MTYIRYIKVGMMRTKYQGVLLLFGNLGKDASTQSTLDILHVDGLNVYKSLEADIFLTNKSADVFTKNDHLPTTFHAVSFKMDATAPFDELHAFRLERDQKKFSTSALFPENAMQQTKITSLAIISRFITTNRPFDYDAGDQSKK